MNASNISFDIISYGIVSSQSPLTNIKGVVINDNMLTIKCGIAILQTYIVGFDMALSV
jgi:hypothetical protein